MAEPMDDEEFLRKQKRGLLLGVPVAAWTVLVAVVAGLADLGPLPTSAVAVVALGSTAALAFRRLRPSGSGAVSGGDSTEFDAAESVRNNPSHPFVDGGVRAACPACGKDVRNTRESFVGHWKRTCDEGGVSRAEFRRAVNDTAPDDVPGGVFRAENGGDAPTDGSADAGAASDGTTATDAGSGWTATDGDGRVDCPACGAPVDDSRDAFLAHWRNDDDCPGPTRPEVGRLLEDPVAVSDVPEDVYRDREPEISSTVGPSNVGSEPPDDETYPWLDAPARWTYVACPTCGEWVENTEDAFVAHWSGPDCPGVLLADLEDALAADSTMPNPLTIGDVTVEELPDDVSPEPAGPPPDAAGAFPGAFGDDDPADPDADGLLDVSGVDPQAADALAAVGYESVADLRRASQDDLSEVRGVGNALAARIKADVGDAPAATSSAPGATGSDGDGSTGGAHEDDAGGTTDSGTHPEGDWIGWLAVDGGGRRVDCPACGTEVFNDRDAFVSHWRDKPDCTGPAPATLGRLTGDPDVLADVPNDVLRSGPDTADDPERAAAVAARSRAAGGAAGETDDGEADGDAGGGAGEEGGLAAELAPLGNPTERRRLTNRLDMGISRLNRAERTLDGDEDATLEDAAEWLAYAEDRLDAAAEVAASLQDEADPTGRTTGERIEVPPPPTDIDRVGESRARTLTVAGYPSVRALREASTEDLAEVLGPRLAEHVESEVGERREPAFEGPVSAAHERLVEARDRLDDLRVRLARERAREAFADDRDRAEQAEQRGDEHRADDAHEDAAAAYREARDAYAAALEDAPEGLPKREDLRASLATVESKLLTAVTEPDVAAAEAAVEEAETHREAGEYEAALSALETARERYESALAAGREQDPSAEVVTECEDALEELEATVETVRTERDRAAVEPHVEAAEEREEAAERRREKDQHEAAATAYAEAVEAYDDALSAASDAFDGTDGLRESRAAAAHEHAVAERDAHVAAADAAVEEAESHREAERHEEARAAFQRAAGRLSDAAGVANEHELDGVEEYRARHEAVAQRATASELAALSDRIVAAREDVADDPDAAEAELEAVLDRLDAVETEREGDLALLRAEARRGLVQVTRVRGEERHDAARERFAAGDHDAAREAFEAARDLFESAREEAADHGIEPDADLGAAVSACESNADAARQALYGLGEDPSLRALPWADRDAAASAARPRGESPGTTPGDPAAVERALPEYESRELIGSGGNADVYRVETGDGEVAALKVPRWQGTMHASAVEEFVAEAEQWAGVDGHDHVVDVLDWGTSPHPWLLLEYLPRSLADAVAGPSTDTGALTLPERLDVVAAVADALEYAHGHGLVHLDVKPENVLLTDEGVPKVGDWGLARRVLDAGEPTGMTLAYSAPEQLDTDRGSVDRRTDVYQVAVLAYELLTGSHPFRTDGADGAGETGGRLELRRAILDGDPAPPSTVADLPPALDAVLLRGLAAAREDRYEAAIQFRDDLRELRAELK